MFYKYKSSNNIADHLIPMHPRRASKTQNKLKMMVKRSTDLHFIYVCCFANCAVLNRAVHF